MHSVQTRKDQMFKNSVHAMWEKERLGLPTIHDRLHIFWQGDQTYNHLDIETIRHLSWIEFIEDNYTGTMMGSPHPNQYRKYNRALTWKEIEEIEDITK
jgi:hypothetical protein